jgi:hypothetical protein
MSKQPSWSKEKENGGGGVNRLGEGPGRFDVTRERKEHGKLGW